VPDLERELAEMGLTPIPDAPRERTWKLIQEELNAVPRITVNVHTRGSIPEVKVTRFDCSGHFVTVQIGDVSFFLDDTKDAQLLGLAIQTKALEPVEDNK